MMVFCVVIMGGFYEDTDEDLKGEIDTSQGQSVFLGEIVAKDKVSCAGWPIKAVERYTGQSLLS